MSETRGFSAMQMLMAFVTGAATGAAVAFLTAPRSGQETREAVQGWVDDTREKAARIPQAMRDAVDHGAKAFTKSYSGTQDS